MFITLPRILHQLPFLTPPPTLTPIEYASTDRVWRPLGLGGHAKSYDLVAPWPPANADTKMMMYPTADELSNGRGKVTLKLQVPLRRVGHCRCFPDHYSWSCPPTFLLPPSFSSLIYASIRILHIPHCTESLLLSPSSHLSDTYLLLLSQFPRVSTAVSTSIIFRRPCHLAFLIPLELSTRFSP